VSLLTNVTRDPTVVVTSAGENPAPVIVTTAGGGGPGAGLGGAGGGVATVGAVGAGFDWPALHATIKSAFVSSNNVV
jgi:hypothetical protein